ncbi:hypothetical protein G9P44_004020 [Scheffersomyces stipitis]|nr:hypothetical protein G9P44_004020 [Scheffersomyces stipitis]
MSSAFGRSASGSSPFGNLNTNSNSNFNDQGNSGFSDSRRTNGPMKQRNRNGRNNSSNSNKNSINNNSNNGKLNSTSSIFANPKLNDLEKKKQGLRNSLFQRKANKENVQRKVSANVESPVADPLDIPTRVIPPQGPVKTMQFSAQELSRTGQLIPNPESFGFHRNNKNIRPRPVPKYLLVQTRLLHTPPFVQNQWDKQNQDKMVAMENENGGRDAQGLYEQFQKMREVERKQMENLGLVDAENISKDLNDAISFQGSCLDMCPVFERVRRSLENNVKALEKDPATGKISRQRAVKAFSRPAAGQPPPLPSEVRPPSVLVQSLDYLVDTVVDMLPEAHSFIWDRTRSIRQDFTYQNSFGPEAIDCNERIVRIHLLCFHVMAGSEVEFSQQQELEQFNKALQTLIEIYQDVRNHGGAAPNEAEFRAYHLLSHIRDPELEREIQKLPPDIFQDSRVQLALQFRSIISQNNVVERGVTVSAGAVNLFVEFFRKVYSSQTPFLMSCLLEIHFSEIRFYALKAMARSYHTKGKAYSGQVLTNMLGFDTLEKLVKFVTYYEIDTFQDGQDILVDLFNKEKLESKYKLNSITEKPRQSPVYSPQLDVKIPGSYKQIINSGKPNGNLALNPQKIDAPVLSKPESAFTQPFSIPSFAASKSTSTAIHPLQTSTSIFGNQSQPTNNPSFQSKDTSFKTSSSKAPASLSSDIQSQNIHKRGQEPLLAPNFAKSASATVSNKSLQFNLGNPSLKLKNDSSAISFTPPIKSSKPVINITKPTSVKYEAEEPPFVKSVPAIIETPIIKKPTVVLRKLSSLPQYPEAVKQIFDSILQGTIDHELSALLPQLIKRQNRHQEHKQIIGSLSEELYDAFISEIVYQTTLESRAVEFYNHNLKLRYIEKVIAVGIAAHKKSELKRNKLAELNSISFKVPVHKRKISTHDGNDSRIVKRRIASRDISSSSVVQTQRLVHELWLPLDYDKFIGQCCSNIKIDIESESIQVKFLLIVENWGSQYSKWLNTKMELNSNPQRQVYEKTVKNDKLTIDILSLPPTNYLNKEFFSNTSFLLFECGLTTSATIPITAKLERDRSVLDKIVSLVDKFSLYKVQILILFWDASGSLISKEEVKQRLSIAEFEGKDNVKGIILCDMTVQDSNIGEVFNGGFVKLSNSFNGELTRRGSKKKAQIRKVRDKNRQLEASEFSSKEPSPSDVLQLKESRMLEKAKGVRKYDYLQSHVRNNTSIANLSATNISANTSLLTRMNNKSYLSNLTFQNRNQNSTFLNINTSTANNSLANETTLNNVSILAGFGNGVVEESTLDNSPSNKKFAVPDNKTVPKKIQQLRDLTAGIRSKYSRKP